MDLMGGVVVRAMRGDRENYRPLDSRLCPSFSPLDVAHALLELYPFKQLYIADLDAIRGTGNHLDTVALLQKEFPSLEIWLDAGMRTLADLSRWSSLDVQWVVGTESLQDEASAIALLDSLGTNAILSLDFHHHSRKGLASLFEQPHLWPQRVIAMTLDRVGSHSGPDMALLELLMKQSGREIFAAGGIRDTHDLEHLKQQEISGALVASALHDGKITTGYFADFQ